MQIEKNDINEERSLVSQLKKGSQLAFSVIYKRYAMQAFSLSFKYLCSKELAEDAVQNLFVKIWLKRETIDENLPINRYIFTILKHDLLNVLRDSKRNILVSDDCLDLLVEIEETVYNKDCEKEQIDLLQKAIAKLSPQKRKIFEMKISGKYTNQAIAEMLSLSVNTIKYQYSQSLKQIRASVRGLAILLLLTYIIK